MVTRDRCDHAGLHSKASGLMMGFGWPILHRDGRDEQLRPLAYLSVCATVASRSTPLCAVGTAER